MSVQDIIFGIPKDGFKEGEIVMTVVKPRPVCPGAFRIDMDFTRAELRIQAYMEGKDESK